MGFAAENIPPQMYAGNFSTPDEIRKFPKGKVEILNTPGGVVGKATLEPGWKWSTCVKPLINTNSCEATHFQYHLSGALEVLMDDGSTRIYRAGEVGAIPAGHDAWVVGDEPVVIVDFVGMATYGLKT